MRERVRVVGGGRWVAPLDVFIYATREMIDFCPPHIYQNEKQEKAKEKVQRSENKARGRALGKPGHIRTEGAAAAV